MIAAAAWAQPGEPPPTTPSLNPAAPDTSQPAPEILVHPEGETPEARVGNISVQGNVVTDSERVIRTFEVIPGTRFSDDAMRRGIRKLFSLGLFTDVWVDQQRRGDVVDLVIHVAERPRVARIDFSGNAKRETSELQKHLSLRIGEPYSETIAQTQVDSLLTYYRSEGYVRATVTATADTLPRNEVALRFRIVEGEKVKIGEIHFVGMSAYNENRLRSAMKTKRKGLFGGGELKDESFAEDIQKLEALYHSHGYRDMRVTNTELKPGSRSDRLALVVTLEEGPVYKMGKVEWAGNHAVPTDVLERAWRQRKSRIVNLYDASRIEAAMQGAYSEYAERGFLYLNVEPREAVHDSTVDLTFIVTEGQPSNVRLVNILGNKGTRENVIRREISVHEGDRFHRSALMRTQGDVMRLGLFEDVAMDFQPADSTDVDINIKVKEKQVGTASAGAGYTSQTGITGFLELSHNNVLGNAQTLALHLERGGKLSNYSLSFTEPWFRGTPTLFGVSGYNTNTQRDIYDERRVGGSVRLGRPLTWPDFSHGSVNYRLENVTIDKLGSDLSVQDATQISGLPIGKPVLTSALGFDFTRNTTNNPFYPTRGSRLQLSTELAGGIFGGGVDFNKNRLDGRVYLPSIIRPFTTMVNVRWGVLTPYLNQTTDVPSYERFRLGGASTTDPLRGYDDYSVVPDKFNRFVVDTAGVDHLVHVRYPGGRFMSVYSLEQQFPVVHPLHGVFFFDAGNVWDLGREVKPFHLKVGAGIGFTIEIPMLGHIGFDYAYGFNRDDGPRFKGHFLIGNVGF